MYVPGLSLRLNKNFSLDTAVLIKINACGCMPVYILYNSVITPVNKNTCLSPRGDTKSETNPFLLHISCFLIVCKYKFLFFHRARGFFVPDLEFSTTKVWLCKDVIYLNVVWTHISQQKQISGDLDEDLKMSARFLKAAKKSERVLFRCLAKQHGFRLHQKEVFGVLI